MINQSQIVHSNTYLDSEMGARDQASFEMNYLINEMKQN